MATNKRTDVIIPEILEAEFYRASSEKTDVFNAASGGTIQLIDTPSKQRAGGEYSKNVRFAINSSIESRMDHTSDSDATFQEIAMAKGARVRMSRKMPVVIYDDNVDVSIATPEEWSINIAQQLAESRLIAIRNLVVGAAVNAIYSMDTPSANYHIHSPVSGAVGSPTKAAFSHTYLNTLLAKMGDSREKIIRLLTHSTLYTDIIGAAIALSSLDSVAGTSLYGGAPATFGRPTLVADISDLTTDLSSSYYDNYLLLGLGVGALRAEIVKAEPVEIFRDIEAERMATKFRADYTVEIGIQGMKWSPSSATPNPTDAQLKTAANWDEDLNDHRECGIVLGVYNSSAD